MSTTRHPPHPAGYRSWKDWATAFLAYSGEGAVIKQPNDPRPIQLAHMLGTGNIGAERALTDGVLMYDPVNSAVVVSIGGVWQTVQATAPLAAALNKLMLDAGLTENQRQLVLDML